jgi:hypothetical protein
MNKRRATGSKDNSPNDIVDEVISSLQGALKPVKKNRTLPLSEIPYDEFEGHCKKMGTTPSKAIDTFIAAFNKRISDSI